MWFCKVLSARQPSLNIIVLFHYVYKINPQVVLGLFCVLFIPRLIPEADPCSDSLNETLLIQDLPRFQKFFYGFALSCFCHALL